MDRQELKIGNIPAILWGNATDKLYIFVHGQKGNKEEGEFLSQIVCAQGWQVLSFDLPEHGARLGERDSFNPWAIVPELKKIMEYVKPRWGVRALYANSIGAWFSMQSFQDEEFEKCLFVSPILDMQRLINNMMQWASVTVEQLETEKSITTTFGQTLSWQYLLYARDNEITSWRSPTHILYATQDNLTERFVVDGFVECYQCGLTVLEDGEHWFNTPQQLVFLNKWVLENC